MNSDFSIRKVLSNAFNACIDNFKIISIRTFEMWGYQLLLFIFFGCMIFSPFNWYTFLGIAWPMSWGIGSMIAFLCSINLYMQYQRCIWYALQNQEIPKFRFKGFSLAIFGLSILLLCIIGCGFVFFVIPGIYLSMRFGYAGIVFAIENASIMNSLCRSWQLTRGHEFEILGLFCLVMILRPLSFIMYPFIEAINVSTYKELVEVENRK